MITTKETPEISKTENSTKSLNGLETALSHLNGGILQNKYFQYFDR